LIPNAQVSEHPIAFQASPASSLVSLPKFLMEESGGFAPLPPKGGRSVFETAPVRLPGSLSEILPYLAFNQVPPWLLTSYSHMAEGGGLEPQGVTLNPVSNRFSYPVLFTFQLIYVSIYI